MHNKRILVIGSSNTDMTIKSERIPVPGETILGGEFIMGQGGKGANQAVAAKRLGGDVEFVCKTGKDIFGDKSIEIYNKENIDTSHILRSEKSSGTALILVDAKAENCIAVAPGANSDFSVEDVRGIADVIRKSDYLLLQLEIPVASVLEAARIAHEAGVYVILNPAPACELPAEIFGYISLVVPNETELALLSGIVEDMDAAVAKLMERGVENVIVTLGSKGARIYSCSDSVHIPARKVEAVDTTAAGDTFCGALCVALSEGKSLAEAAGFASSASAISVQRMGAQSSIPYRKEIKDYE